MIAMWERSWAEFVPFLDFLTEIRTLIYTTNGIESLELQVPPGGPPTGGTSRPTRPR